MSGNTRFYDGLDDDIKAILLAQIRNIWTHTSTAIEGNTLTLGETAFLIEEGLTVSGKPLKDHEEVFGHAKAIELVYRFLVLERLSQAEIFALHKAILTERIVDAYQPVGAWKNESNYTSYITKEGRQDWRQFPSPGQTPKLMAQWIEVFNAASSQKLTKTDAARFYAESHLDFVSIHPFFDGNGRMARLLCNLPLLKSGHPPFVVPTTDRFNYKKAISDYQGTIANLADLKNLADLPRNAEREHFVSQCRGYWAETVGLVERAQEIQESRKGVEPR